MDEIINKMVNAYFNEPEKSVREVFESYTSELTEEEKTHFYEILEKIIY